ncbi:MAG TPA: c-type cytochrome [Micropepsaceae bacterium]|nr:c-type cytochrome [Micropepsaceae bacterium]
MTRKSKILGVLVIALLGATKVASGQTGETWPQPNADSLAPGAWKDTVLYGRKLFNETYSVIGPEVPQASMRYAGNNLSCQSCHLQGGTQKFAIPMIGIYGVFPLYIGREDEVRTLEERIEGCMERSMNGRAIPIGGKEMKALVSYIQFLSTNVPVGKSPEGRGSPNLPLLTRAADPKRGADVFEKNCTMCHQSDGQGQRKGAPGSASGYVYPPLWGPDSFNDGAGMHRLIASASFIHANMPFGTHYDSPEISVEDAWDVAAYINSQPRPKRANLEADYPNRARKPVDAPFPPFLDKFPLEQHRLGPFQPITDAQSQAAR